MAISRPQLLPSPPVMTSSRMARFTHILGLAAVAASLAGCASGGYIGDHIPQWAGGLPKDLPPRPGTPEDEGYRNRLEHPPAATASAKEGSAKGQAGQATPEPRPQ